MFLFNGRYTQRPENHAEASISGLEINGSLPTWRTHPLGKVLGSRLHSLGDRLLSFTTKQSNWFTQWLQTTSQVRRFCIFLVMGYGLFTLCINTEQSQKKRNWRKLQRRINSFGIAYIKDIQHNLVFPENKSTTQNIWDFRVLLTEKLSTFNFWKSHFRSGFCDGSIKGG